MRKINVIFIVMCILFTTSTSSVYAQSQKQEETHSIMQIMADDSIQISDDSYMVKKDRLIGTSLEGKDVFVRDDDIYVNGARSYSVKIDVGGILVAFLIDGMILYATGYSGAYFAAQAIAAILAFAVAQPVGTLIIVIALLTLNSSTVNSYKTNTGNECYLAPFGNGYYCKFSAGI